MNCVCLLCQTQMRHPYYVCVKSVKPNFLRLSC
jgi:hypothetical protein